MKLEQQIAQALPNLTKVAALPSGGQKFVFSAQHATDGAVVIKIIKSGQDLERIKREILAVQTVKSRRVPKILEVGIADFGDTTSIWLREERVTGASVRQVLAKGPLSTVEVGHLVLQVLEALTAAEQARIVHRDVKPENLMRSDDGSYWLIDFGIARHLDLQSLTATAAFIGACTPGYAPPEQYRNQKRSIDARADLFALAVTAVECLTAKHPFKDGARDLPEVFRRLEGTPLAVPMISGDKDGAFRDLILAMGQRRIDPRPASAAQAFQWMEEVASKCGF